MLGRAIVAIIGSLAVMFWYSWQLSLITISGVIPTGFATMHFSGKLRIIQRQVQQVKSEMTVVAEESYQNIRTVKAFANEDEESRKFKKGNENLFKAGRIKAVWMGGQTSIL
jgi:ATP-binding cassette subfamily B protein